LSGREREDKEVENEFGEGLDQTMRVMESRTTESSYKSIAGTMLKYILLFPFLAVAGCAATPQRSSDSESYYFDCDTPPGKFSDWNRTVAAKTLRATGTLELKESRQDPRWYPVGSVWLIASGESDRAGMQAFVAPDSPDYLQVRLVRVASRVDAPVFASLKWKDGPIPFSLSLSATNVLTATVAGKSQSISLAPFAMAKFSLTCSTGDFHFNDVNVVTGE
jgi:hypothetical protein